MNSGSTAPLNVESTNDVFCFFVEEYIGSAVASPSGKFCKEMPKAIKKAGIGDVCKATTAPNAKPIDSPSGML